MVRAQELCESQWVRLFSLSGVRGDVYLPCLTLRSTQTQCRQYLGVDLPYPNFRPTQTQFGWCQWMLTSCVILSDLPRPGAGGVGGYFSGAAGG